MTNKSVSLGKALVKKGLMPREIRLPYVKLSEAAIDKDALELVPAGVAYRLKFMPLKLKKDRIVIATADPFDLNIMDDLGLFLGRRVDTILTGEKEVFDAIRIYYGLGADTIDNIVRTESDGVVESLHVEEAENIEDMSRDASIIKFVNQILGQAVKDNVTDIHIEPYERELRVRYRIDGLLYNVAVPRGVRHFGPAIISRIKVMANLDIAEKRLPQDGRVKVRMNDEDLDLRVSILPTQFGESVDIRILRTSMLYDLERLGFETGDLTELEKLIRKPHGIIFVTGPTGSGKTTTLYSCLTKINSDEKKIITIEDPIEYQLRGITQIQVNPKIGLDFARGLRSVLRHDPDIMMVGEARDTETIETTIRVALTGHLVFSTMHTNDASGGIARLLDMGIEPYLITSSVECFIAQRLVRLICPVCREERVPDTETLREFGEVECPGSLRIYEGKGCEQCKFSGYRGRTGIYEFLPVTERIKDLILHRASSDMIKKEALSSGMRTLRMDGWSKALKGQTTISEVMRVTKED